jgi:hypothetical protein
MLAQPIYRMVLRVVDRIELSNINSNTDAAFPYNAERQTIRPTATRFNATCSPRWHWRFACLSRRSAESWQWQPEHCRRATTSPRNSDT